MRNFQSMLDWSDIMAVVVIMLFFTVAASGIN